MAMVQLRSREGGGLGAVPQTRNKIEIMSHQKKIALVDFSYFYRGYTNDPALLKNGNNLFQEKTINQDTFPLVPMLICV